jgi:hypothetical protein
MPKRIAATAITIVERLSDSNAVPQWVSLNASF